MGPVKIASRIDVPRQGASVASGQVTFGGVAWHQETGIAGVQVSLDGGPWTDATLGRVPSLDTWVQWRAALPVDKGDHEVRVRAIDHGGAVQTGVVRAVAPDGATGWDAVRFSAR
jgi:hypothetical protein